MNCAKHEYWAPGYHAGYATESYWKDLKKPPSIWRMVINLIDIFVIKRLGGYCACGNWKSRTNISCRFILIASIAQSQYLNAFYELGLLLIIWIKAV